ncbi:MAG: PEP-CTERM sorting domain-containing protein [Xenococcaceae cyanobacterium MO_167.B27]|nr:PEP-CTERM sorting domain-containing protein [Xenococcaceae cyanobacterium MO_167.B27]
MNNNYFNLIGISLLTTSISAYLVSPAQANTLNFSITEFTGSNTEVEFTLEDIAPNTVRFTSSVINTNTGNFGDTVGLYFDVADTFDSTNFIATLIDVTPDAGTISGLPDNFSLIEDFEFNGGGPANPGVFDLGVEIGVKGASDKGDADYFQTVVFDLSANGLTVEEFTSQKFGARLQSVGSNIGSGEGSAKLAGISPISSDPSDPTDVPEPGTILGLGLFTLGTAANARKTRKQQ